MFSVECTFGASTVLHRVTTPLAPLANGVHVYEQLLNLYSQVPTNASVTEVREVTSFCVHWPVRGMHEAYGQ